MNTLVDWYHKPVIETYTINDYHHQLRSCHFLAGYLAEKGHGFRFMGWISDGWMVMEKSAIDDTN